MIGHWELKRKFGVDMWKNPSGCQCVVLRASTIVPRRRANEFGMSSSQTLSCGSWTMDIDVKLTKFDINDFVWRPDGEPQNCEKWKMCISYLGMALGYKEVMCRRGSISLTRHVLEYWCYIEVSFRKGSMEDPRPIIEEIYW